MIKRIIAIIVDRQCHVGPASHEGTRAFQTFTQNAPIKSRSPIVSASIHIGAQIE